MKLKTKYILFIAIIHLVCLWLSYVIYAKNIFIFLLAEVLIIFSIILAINLYQQLIAPLTYLKQGINAIKDKDFNVKFLPTGKKELDGLVDVYNKMIDELRAERTKQQAQHFFLEKLIQTSPTGIVIMDFDSNIKQINPKAEEILNNNQEDLLNKLKQIKVGTAKIVRLEGLRTYKIQKSKFIDRGFERVFMMMEEVTAEIFEAEKKAYSKVIRMMAHEVNNTVGPVNSIMATVLNHQTDDDPSLKNALQVAIDRNQNLNLFMRNFADVVKLPQANKKEIDLIVLINSVVELMKFNTTEKTIQFDIDLPAVPYLLKADQLQLEQVFINIIKNAIEAINQTGSIKITLDPILHQLSIADNGKGLTEINSDQLFSPFFSTKKDGQGIGLTLVREILLNHGFEFSLKTTAPNETVFSIQLN